MHPPYKKLHTKKPGIKTLAFFLCYVYAVGTFTNSIQPLYKSIWIISFALLSNSIIFPGSAVRFPTQKRTKAFAFMLCTYQNGNRLSRMRSRNINFEKMTNTYSIFTGEKLTIHFRRLCSDLDC